jgi:hypothetical protein
VPAQVLQCNSLRVQVLCRCSIAEKQSSMKFTWVRGGEVQIRTRIWKLWRWQKEGEAGMQLVRSLPSLLPTLHHLCRRRGTLPASLLGPLQPRLTCVTFSYACEVTLGRQETGAPASAATHLGRQEALTRQQCVGAKATPPPHRQASCLVPADQHPIRISTVQAKLATDCEAHRTRGYCVLHWWAHVAGVAVASSWSPFRIQNWIASSAGAPRASGCCMRRWSLGL